MPIINPGKKPIFLPLLVSLLLLTSPGYSHETVDDFLDLPLEDLLSIEVTSVAKKKQRLSEVAAAVFVITREDIRRSGVTSIPEALRMAPGIQVGRIDASKWAISSRGFNNQFANKLLVMIDGRTVYTPAFSGVYWDVQDTLLEDIDRIEVIRGPGATVWGANAVNGVINIITRQAGETQGGLLTAGAGNEEKTFAGLRYGAEMGDDTHARFYLKYNDRDSSYAPTLADDAGDVWQSLRGGFRIDRQATKADSFTVQGDAYDIDENQTINLWKDPADPANAIYAPFFLAANTPDKVDASGWDLLAKWDHTFSGQSSTTLQIYYDHTRRSEALLAQEHDTLDIDFQHRFQPSAMHEVIWGLGYRRIEDSFDNTFSVAFLPDSRDTDLYSAFVQDEIELLPGRLRLTLGSKFEHNDYTGYEVQPSARLVWLVDSRSTLWGAVSRAVRTPSRVEDGSRLVGAIAPLPPTFVPVVLYTFGDSSYQSEELLAYEIGYRFQPEDNLLFDLAVFYNDYNELRSFEQITVSPLPGDTVFANKLSARSYGLELAVDWRPLEWWRLQSSYSFVSVRGSPDDDSTDADSDNLIDNSSPTHQLSLRSMMDLGNHITLDLWAYHVDDLKQTNFSVDKPVSDYTSLNARLAWRPRRELELSLVGQNLLDKRHLEFVGESITLQTEVERSVYTQARWNF
jgi:iron complex outermembrane receptor protein